MCSWDSFVHGFVRLAPFVGHFLDFYVFVFLCKFWLRFCSFFYSLIETKELVILCETLDWQWISFISGFIWSFVIFFFFFMKEEKCTSKITNVKCMSVLRPCACKKLWKFLHWPHIRWSLTPQNISMALNKLLKHITYSAFLSRHKKVNKVL